MDVTVEFEGPLADAAGGRRHRVELPPGSTAADGLRAVAAGNAPLRGMLFRSDGSVRLHLTVTVDGRPVERPAEAPVDGAVTVAPALGC